jgi:hypothetical protein
MRLAVVVCTLLALNVEAFVPPSVSKLGRLNKQAYTDPSFRQSPSWRVDTTASTQLFSSLVDQKELINFFLMKLIENGVPATFTIITILVAAKAFRNKNSRDDAFSQVNPAVSELYDDLYATTEKKSQSIFSGLGKRNKGPLLTRNAGIPTTEYISITNLNEKYDSYEYNMIKATQSKAAAAANLRTKNFDRALQVSTFGTELEPFEKSKLLQAEENLLKVGSKIMASVISAETQLTDLAIREEMSKFGFDANVLDPAPVNGTVRNSSTSSSNLLSKMIGGKNDIKRLKRDLENELVNGQKALLQLETSFIQNVTQILGPEKASAFRQATLGDIATRGVGKLLRQLQDRPLSTMLRSNSDEEDCRTKSLFVMRFPGDVRASQVNELREEVTAVVRTAKPGDEALLVLESGGGTVTGYGLAAGQLKRFKEAGMKLTVCVEQVAASGGYMMCCVADRIVASPMAVLGSIGVISDIPNFYERLAKEGM